MKKAGSGGWNKPRGVVLKDGVSCGVCERVQSLPPEGKPAVRSMARATGWRYVEAWGWICPPCQNKIPGLRDPRRRFMDPGPKVPLPERIQVSLKFD